MERKNFSFYSFYSPGKCNNWLLIHSTIYYLSTYTAYCLQLSDKKCVFKSGTKHLSRFQSFSFLFCQVNFILTVLPNEISVVQIQTSLCMIVLHKHMIERLHLFLLSKMCQSRKKKCLIRRLASLQARPCNMFISASLLLILCLAIF